MMADQSIHPPPADADIPHDAGTSLWLGLHLRLNAAVLAGLIAGGAFLALELLSVYVYGVGVPFGPAYVALHGLTGEDAMPDRLDPALVVGGIFLHFVLSVAITIPLAVLVHPWKSAAMAAALGAVLGVLLFYLNEALLAILLPVWAEVRYALLLVHFAAFGAVAALAYWWLQYRHGRDSRRHSPLSRRPQ